MADFQNVSIQNLYVVLLRYINYVEMQSPNNASTINAKPDCFLTALKIAIDNVFK